MNRLDLSIPMFEDLVQRMRGKLGENHPTTLLAVANLGVNYRDAGRYAAATPLLEQAFAAADQFPQLSWVGKELAVADVKAGKKSEAKALIEKLMVSARQLPSDSPELGGQLASYGKLLNELGEFVEAEKLMRECLSIREKNEPEAWTTCSAKALLGEALLGQKNLTDAEPLLLASYEGLKKHEAAIPQASKSRIPETIDRLIELYTAMEKPESVEKWQAERKKQP